MPQNSFLFAWDNIQPRGRSIDVHGLCNGWLRLIFDQAALWQCDILALLIRLSVLYLVHLFKHDHILLLNLEHPLLLWESLGHELVFNYTLPQFVVDESLRQKLASLTFNSAKKTICALNDLCDCTTELKQLLLVLIVSPKNSQV